MTVQATVVAVATRTRLTAICCGAATVLACAGVSVCSGSLSRAAAASYSSPLASAAHGSASPNGAITAKVSRFTSESPPHPPTHRHHPGHHPSPPPPPPPPPSPPPPPPPPPPTTAPPTTAPPTTAPPTTAPPTLPPPPTVPPSTGGGGTAGLQDGMVFGLGGAAILAGAVSVAYRRRLTKARR